MNIRKEGNNVVDEIQSSKVKYSKTLKLNFINHIIEYLTLDEEVFYFRSNDNIKSQSL